MTDGLLDDIIHWENQIQAEVSAEQMRAKAWAEREVLALEKALSEKQDHILARRKEVLETKRKEIKQEGAELVAAEQNWCQRLKHLDDIILSKAIKLHLTSLLPGGDYDHPHGQN